MDMGGTKKKPLSQVEKAQAAAPKPEKKEKETKTSGQKVKLSAIARVDEQQALKSLSQLKAITIYAAAKALGVNASVASSLLRSLESKNLIGKVGGFSGHYVYSPLSS